MITRKSMILEDGSSVQAICPVIVSASRCTDIPAFYADWFFHRLQVGYSVWTNPFNGKKSYISYDATRFIVFWSKIRYRYFLFLIFSGRRISGVIFSSHSMIMKMKIWSRMYLLYFSA